MSNIGGGPLTKTRSLDVAPVGAVVSLAGDSISGGISDVVEVAHTMIGESLVQKVNVVDFINGEVVLALQVARISGGSGGSKRLIVSSVSSETPDDLVASSIVQDLLEDGNDLLEVVVPTEPSSVGGIEIRHNVAKAMELLQGVGDTLLVGGLALLALLVVHIGSEIGKRIGLNNGHDGDIRIFLELGDNLVNILSLVGIQGIGALVVGAGELAVGGTGGAVTVG